jgi:hypothetical protein
MSDQFVGFDIIFHISVDPVPTTNNDSRNFFFDSAVQMTCFTLLKRKKKKIIHRIDCAVPLEKTYNKTTPNKKVDQDRKIPEKSNELPDRKHFCKKGKKSLYWMSWSYCPKSLQRVIFDRKKRDAQSREMNYN